ncbi:GDP-fucose transporter 1-like [Macrosteles quadrilineatus]|uniref:GDP-fucose transporter 1-like n=1 Tax=Macrosteles quadrilineatus TaxID=74068 RepID=UPI0023E1E962|nr:GDP-fucose transporter 1-like [Macrosteles quadrilineatus]XP_054275585.1 GDP-fucose transporter 1-like [Macrosteles quadrilineatus]
METLFSKYVHITLVVALYWVVSIFTVFINKALLSGDDVKLEAPIFIAWFQCVVSALICFILARISKRFPHQFSFPSGNPFDLDVARQVIPLSLLFAGMICFNNLCLKYVGVAFYYVGRSLTTVFNVLFTYLVLHEKTSIRCIVCCIIIVAGFLMGVNEENGSGTLSVMGVLYGVLASLCVALYSINTKKVLPVVNNHIWLLSFYNNVYSSVIFIPFIIIYKEVPVIISYEKLDSLYFWTLMVVGGLCGLAIGYVTSLQIKVTSPLTHNISGTAKACAQTVLATYWYDESKTRLWWVSNMVVLAGSAAYTRVRQQEVEERFRRRLVV